MAKLTISELDKELRNKEIRPLYLIYGPENYLINTAVSRIKEAINKLNGETTDADNYAGKGAKGADIVASAETVSMFTKQRLIIVSEVHQLKDTEALVKYFERPSRTTTIIFVGEKADGRTKFFQTLTEKGASIECKQLYNDKVPDWIRMEATRIGRSISMEACRLMAELVGNNMGELAQAIEKISLYIGDKTVIEADDVDVVLTETGRKDAFAFADAIGHKNMAEALHILDRLTAFAENEVMILSLLARHWRMLSKTKGTAVRGGYVDKGTLARTLGVNPFFVEGYMEQAKIFTPKELRDGFKRLYQTDKMLKSAKTPKKAILEKCIRELIS